MIGSLLWSEPDYPAEASFGHIHDTLPTKTRILESAFQRRATFQLLCTGSSPRRISLAGEDDKVVMQILRCLAGSLGSRKWYLAAFCLISEASLAIRGSSGRALHQARTGIPSADPCRKSLNPTAIPAYSHLLRLTDLPYSHLLRLTAVQMALQQNLRLRWRPDYGLIDVAGALSR